MNNSDISEEQGVLAKELEKKTTIACKDCKNPPINDDYSCKWFGECEKHQ